MKRVLKIGADKFKFADLNTDWKYSPAETFHINFIKSLTKIFGKNKDTRYQETLTDPL